MTRITHHFAFPDRFVAGTVGEPGQRTFFLQVREGNRLNAVVCEKEQVVVLADHVERILEEVAKIVDEPDLIPPPLQVSSDLRPLELPLEPDFRVGTMTLAWDSAMKCVAVELFSVEEESQEIEIQLEELTDDVQLSESEAAIFDAIANEPPTSAESIEIRISPAVAREFIARSRALVDSGRPVCPFCSQPINPEGHICPRSNGYRRDLFV